MLSKAIEGKAYVRPRETNSEWLKFNCKQFVSSMGKLINCEYSL